MRFVDDPAAPEVPITWYFANEGAPFLPFYNVFSSGNWAKEKEGWTGPGEVAWRPRPWSDGEPPGPIPIAVRSNQLPQWTTYTTPNFTGALALNAFAGHSVFVMVWAIAAAGPGTMACVDDGGNVYTTELSRIEPGAGGKLCLFVFRTKALATGPLHFTINFPASVAAVTFTAIDVEGLRDDPPVIATQIGTYPVQPKLTGFATGHGSQFVLATMTPAVMSAVSTQPVAFTGLGSRLDLTFASAAGDSGYRLLANKASPAIAWSIIGLAGIPWITGALAYRGVPKYAPAPVNFCGSEAKWQGHATLADHLITDLYGVSTCCENGNALLLVNCDLAGTQTLRMRINAIRNHGATSQAFVGMILEFEWVSECTWMITEESKLALNANFVDMQITAGDTSWSILTFGTFSVLYPSSDCRNRPPYGCRWTGLFPFSYPPGPDNWNEEWDVYLFVPPVLR